MVFRHMIHYNNHSLSLCFNPHSHPSGCYGVTNVHGPALLPHLAWDPNFLLPLSTTRITIGKPTVKLYFCGNLYNAIAISMGHLLPQHPQQPQKEGQPLQQQPLQEVHCHRN